MNEKKFYICKHCGNIIGMIHSSGVNVVCCGDPMTELTPNTVDAAQEKHLPVVKVEGNIVKVNVGSVDHPMSAEHHIAWIYVETMQGGQRKNLVIDGKPEAEFALTAGDKVVGVYAYCNLHGLWLTKVN